MAKRRDRRSGQRIERRQDKWIYLLLLLALGAQTMIVELAIPRLLAPTFGNTLFCWTAIIAVVLVALTLGYHIGGRVATQQNARRLIWILATLSALWVLGLSLWGVTVTASFAGFGLMAGPLVAALVLAALPTGCSAAVVPLAVETRPEGPAKAAGQCYAWSTVGSVLGVLLTGYVLLPQLGISRTMMAGALGVFAMILINGRWLVGLLGLMLIALTVIGPSSSDPGILFDKSNGYHRIRIVRSSHNEKVRTLYLDSTVEGAVELGSSYPVLKYQRKIDQIARAVPELSRVFFIGGGSFSMPRYVEAKYPHAVVDVVEIDPDVVNAARQYLELSDEVNVFLGDGRRVLGDRATPYDLIVTDAFHGVREIPFHLATREFNRLVRERLRPHGLYAVNAIGQPAGSSLVRSVIQTIREEFEHVSLLYDYTGVVENVWVLASRSPIAIGRSPKTREAGGRVLVDDDAPVEFLIAADLVQRF
jgi:spermidine synthase